MSISVLVDTDFDTTSQAYRRELHLHCYRMLASYDEAEDAVQETYVRAWRSWDTFSGEHVRAWLYRIATNVCVDLIRARSRQVARMESYAEIGWLTPYPDRLLDEIASPDDEPEVVAVAKETIELAFLAALQVLPPRQRAALLAREVLGLPAEDMATMLEMTVPAVNSALQRARSTLRKHLPSHRNEWSVQPPNPAERELLAAFIDAHERCDAAAAVAVAAADLRITMPPNPIFFHGLEAIRPLLERAFGPNRDGDWRLLPTRANRMPAAASYLRRPGDSEFRGFKLDVLRVEGDVIAEITTFGWSQFERLGLPLTLAHE